MHHLPYPGTPLPHMHHLQHHLPCTFTPPPRTPSRAPPTTSPPSASRRRRLRRPFSACCPALRLITRCERGGVAGWAWGQVGAGEGRITGIAPPQRCLPCGACPGCFLSLPGRNHEFMAHTQKPCPIIPPLLCCTPLLCSRTSAMPSPPPGPPALTTQVRAATGDGATATTSTPWLKTCSQRWRRGKPLWDASLCVRLRHGQGVEGLAPLAWLACTDRGHACGDGSAAMRIVWGWWGEQIGGGGTMVPRAGATAMAWMQVAVTTLAAHAP